MRILKQMRTSKLSRRVEVNSVRKKKNSSRYIPSEETELMELPHARLATASNKVALQLQATQLCNSISRNSALGSFLAKFSILSVQLRLVKVLAQQCM